MNLKVYNYLNMNLTLMEKYFYLISLTLLFSQCKSDNEKIAPINEILSKTLLPTIDSVGLTKNKIGQSESVRFDILFDESDSDLLNKATITPINNEGIFNQIDKNTFWWTSKRQNGFFDIQIELSTEDTTAMIDLGTVEVAAAIVEDFSDSLSSTKKYRISGNVKSAKYTDGKVVLEHGDTDRNAYLYGSPKIILGADHLDFPVVMETNFQLRPNENSEPDDYYHMVSYFLDFPSIVDYPNSNFLSTVRYLIWPIQNKLQLQCTYRGDGKSYSKTFYESTDLEAIG